MSKMISVASGFQYSVNIGYDLYDDNKLKNFIPTRASLLLIKSILLSIDPNSSKRARILIGAYGKGKSHIVLMLLSILMKRDFSLLEKMPQALRAHPKIRQLIKNYYASKDKILPVIITGSNTSLAQAFLVSLQRTLKEYDFLDVMPETNYEAAISTINRWKVEFPETLAVFETMVKRPSDNFINDLKDYDVNAYKKFEELYPKLTAGSIFNPFLGFDVVEIYESVAKGLKAKGYSGIYVVYDEFSKYLEANIKTARVSDTKMLQDFAEKCTRSGQLQLHLMLISHKEISNYIDILPKQKVDGLRGISERFEHIHLNNNFSQTYEIIETVIQHEDNLWCTFYNKNKKFFDDLFQNYNEHPIFSDIEDEKINKIVEGCYPLHPVSTFILPRLSEKIAQNERTLFTFLSAEGGSTLNSLLNKLDDTKFELITPDRIYDYFEPLFKKEVYSGALHDNYILTRIILEKLERSSLESKIIKTLSIIYALEQFEKLTPTISELYEVYSAEFSAKEIKKAIDNLLEKRYVVYLKRSNGFLKLKQTSGINIKEKIVDTIEKQKNSVTTKQVLNDNNFNAYMYPSRYNSEKEMTRYFTFKFINANEVKEGIDWGLKAQGYPSDGFVYGIVTNDQTDIEIIKEILTHEIKNGSRSVFILPKKHQEIKEIIFEFNAVSFLKENAIEDKILFEEYEVIYEDLLEVINSYISSYTRPENGESEYIYMLEELNIQRKSDLSELLSEICDSIYFKTPIINNESINRNKLTTVANNSRGRIITALLRNELDVNLGFTGNGQEVSIMRSVLVRTGILALDAYPVELNLFTKDNNMNELLAGITKFIRKARKYGVVELEEIYDYLLLPEHNISLRRGLIPIYLAVVFHNYKQEIVIKNKHRQLPMNADTLEQIDVSPELFSLYYLEWNEEKEYFIEKMEILFKDYIVLSEKMTNPYDFIALAMKRWYLALPKFTKEAKRDLDGNKIDRKNINFLSSLRTEMSSQELLFEQVPIDFGYTKFNSELYIDIKETKKVYDELLLQTNKRIIKEVKLIFSSHNEMALEKLERISLTSIIKDWLDTLDPNIETQVFSDGTDKCLNLFNNITADENDFIIRLSKITTDLRVEDWNGDTFQRFKNRLNIYKETAEQYNDNQFDNDKIDEMEANVYQVSFIGKDGELVVKRFEKTDRSKRGELLFNTIEAQLSAMGQSISENEKRQVLMEILSNLL